MKSAGRERRTGWWGIVTIALVLAAGCRDAATSNAGGATTTTVLPSTTAAPPTTEVSAAPSTAAAPLLLEHDPPVIDLAYAQRVLDNLFHIDGEVSRILYRDRTITTDAEAMLTSYLFGDALDGARKGLDNDLSVNFSSYRDPPGDPRITGIRVVSSRPGCIAMLADSDFGPRYRMPIDVQRNIAIVLQRNRNPTSKEHLLNPTDWVETAGGTLAPGKNLAEVCK